MCVCDSWNPLFYFLNSCGHHLHPVGLSRLAEPSIAFFLLVFNQKVQWHYADENNFENAIQQLLLNQSFELQWVVRSLSERKGIAVMLGMM